MINMLITLVVSSEASSSSTNYATMASAFKTVSIVMFALALVCALFAIYAFIRFKIPTIINDLTGRTAKKSIAKMRSENEKSGDKSFRPTAKAKDRGTTTDKIRDSEKLLNNKQPQPEKQVSEATDLLNSNETQLLTNNAEILNERTETLVNNETVVLENSTTVLDEGTTVLSGDVASSIQEKSSKLELIQNIVLIHTNEVI